MLVVLLPLLLLLAAAPVNASRSQLNDGDSIPDVAPPLDPERIRETFINLGSDDNPKTSFIKLLFTGAKYVKQCDNVKKPVVLPVYYTYGQRVDLPCVTCMRHNIHNGKMRHWMFLRLNDHIDSVDETNSNYFFSTLERYMKGSTKHIEMTDLFDIIEGDIGKQKGYKTEYFQRDGRLIIVGTGLEAAGLYWCTDEDTNNYQQFLYFLVPSGRYVQSENGDKSEEILNEKAAETFPKIPHWRQNIAWDLKHWNSIPALLYDDTKFGCQNTTEGCLKYIPHRKDSPAPETKLRVILGKGSFMEDTNLHTYVQWSPWSSCKRPEQTVRTRVGHCMFNFANTDESKSSQLFMPEDGKQSLPDISNLFELTRKYGLRMHSGAIDYRRLTELNVKRLFIGTFGIKVNDADRANFHRCYHMNADATELKDITDKTEGNNVITLVGRPLFENEPCPPKTEEEYKI
ncbi:hypothetical protein QR680_003830 [Steinernema hermaphroditum]|uniref:Uncharacterized protein n=1 Tax=Steinernema hermaphroditum TaxID=289476 RepID=A0AA39HN42_9BILA|nr:hypothetical protein QR680_003830 [Steinernema hermaphroditum]